MIDSGKCVSISPNGDLGICEHYIDSKFIGNISNPTIKNFDVIRNWRKYTPAADICKNCSIYADCLRVQGCTDENRCDVHE